VGGLLETIRNAWKIPELKKRLLYTLLLILIFRIGAFIPIPGITGDMLQNFFKDLTAFRMLAGNVESNSIFAMSITPYINASIIMQLLTVAIRRLEELAKEGGEEGRRKINRWTRYLTVGLGLLQAFFMTLNLYLKKDLETPSWLFFIVTIASLTAGTAFLMWLGEQITERGVGNGISIIIFAGIVSNLPVGATIIYGTFIESNPQLLTGIIGAIALIALLVMIIVFIIYVTEAERRIPVQYAKRVVGRKMYGGQSTHIPIKINSSGVLPIIFAVSLLQFPQVLVSLIAPNANNAFVNAIKGFSQQWYYHIILALLVMGFTFFYSMVYFNPVDIANNLKKNGGFIPGIRPGKPTADYIKTVSMRITTVGAFFLALITLLPNLLTLIFRAFGYYIDIWFGSTSILIMVGVALETVKQIESYMLMRHYKGFLE